MNTQLKRVSILQEEIDRLGPWFHNLHLPQGTQTAPNHVLGDYPFYKWQRLKDHLPSNLEGWNVLDIGCNAGFYSFEIAARGANVLAIDSDDHYLKQARWAVSHFGLEHQITFQRMEIYDLVDLDERYDLVLFMGVLYHLRHPLLGLDIAARKARNLLVFQCLLMPEDEICNPDDDYSMDERHLFLRPGWPRMAFVENRFAGDPTNWWIPNRAAAEAMMRSCGLRILKTLSHEIYVCGAGQASDRVVHETDKASYAVRRMKSVQGSSGT